MNIQFIDFEQGIHSTPTNEIREVLPMQAMMVSTQLKTPYTGLFYFRGEVLPVIGAIPTAWDTENSDETPWIVVHKKHVRISQGMPSWNEETLPQCETINLEKSA